MTTEKAQRIKTERFWWVLLIALPTVAIAVASLPQELRRFPSSFSSSHSPAGLDPDYRYRFDQLLGNNLTPKLMAEQEIAFYQERLGQDPESGLNRAFLAEAYLKMAQATSEGSWYLLAEGAARRSLASLPFDNTTAQLVLARIAEAQHDFPTALRLAEQVGFTNRDALAVAVTTNLAMGNVAAADRAAQELVALVRSPGTLNLRGLVRVAQGLDAEAIADFEGALAAEEPGQLSGSAKTRTLLGRFYSQRGQLQQAEALYLEALRLVPRYPLALVLLAELKTRQGQYRQGQEYYELALTDSENTVTLFDHRIAHGMARLKSLQGDKAAAKSWLEKAETLLRATMPKDGSGSFGHRGELAALLLDRGGEEDVAEALALMQAEVKIRRDAPTMTILASALLRSGKPAEAQEAIALAMQSGIRDAGIFYRAGEVEKALGNETTARAYFQQASQTDPTFDAQARRMLGLDMEFSY
ncbi:hypothetical protein [Oscillatoria sp. HE19RPO]|uniref:tetratricopeptide repeat protein n=1 Tax=Oscillatoria sp. HE19RPO TaxID=2954806 RepID=UPI0020C3B7EE|nr:hypothetical protein [Oscillatoria sp. HE19RPO]